MSFEGHPKNSFRAAVQAGGPPPIVVSKKKAKLDKSAAGLDGVSVPRAEARRVDERGGDRHRLSDEQASVRFKRRTYDVELINVSRGGAMIEGPLKVKLWDRLELVLGGGTALECVVRWVRGDRAGVEFAHETRIDCDVASRDTLLRDVIRNSFPEFQGELGPGPELEQDGDIAGAQPHQREAVRHPLIWSGILHHDYEWEAVRLRNISTTGALVECAAEFPKGVSVFLDLGTAGKLAAFVCWSRGNQTGLEFAQPFDIQKLSAAKPEVASAEWLIPDYLDPNGNAPVPAVEPWKRASVEELSRSLGG